MTHRFRMVATTEAPAMPCLPCAGGDRVVSADATRLKQCAINGFALSAAPEYNANTLAGSNTLSWPRSARSASSRRRNPDKAKSNSRQPTFSQRVVPGVCHCSSKSTADEGWRQYGTTLPIASLSCVRRLLISASEVKGVFSIM